jgi:uncharacterized protein
MANSDPIQIIRGPRQCGKSSLVLHLDPTYTEISLDDPAMRELAESDPELFLKQFGAQKLFIDEAQYAPNLFPSLKRKADLYKRSRKEDEPPQTIVRLTGSNQIMLDKNVKESLSGRASFFDMNTLCVAEILGAKKVGIQDIIYQGGWPEIYAEESKDTKKFLDDYINSYVEKDIVLAAGIQKRREFLNFLRLLAGRVGQILDFSSLGRESGVDAKTIKDWISVLETMHVISLLQPYSSNLSSRIIKSPKVYFLDTGLACRLQGWTSPGPILTSPQQGPLFENLVFCEIFKTNINFDKGWRLYHWRSRDGEEIDFIIEKSPTERIFIEAKVTAQKTASLESFPELKKVFGKSKKNGAHQHLVCHQEGSQVLANRIPVALLQNELLRDWPF